MLFIPVLTLGCRISVAARRPLIFISAPQRSLLAHARAGSCKEDTHQYSRLDRDIRNKQSWAIIRSTY